MFLYMDIFHITEIKSFSKKGKHEKIDCLILLLKRKKEFFIDIARIFFV